MICFGSEASLTWPTSSATWRGRDLQRAGRTPGYSTRPACEGSDMLTVKKPPYPVGELVTWELSRYREQLESVLATLPADTALRQIYAGRLTEVISEQETRQVTTGIPSGWADA